MGAVVSTWALSRCLSAIRRHQRGSSSIAAVHACNQTPSVGFVIHCGGARMQSDAISGVRHLQSMLGRDLVTMELELRRAQPAL